MRKKAITMNIWRWITWGIVGILAAVIIITGLCTFLLPPLFVSVVNCPVDILQTENHPANNRQQDSVVWLGCYNGQVYCYNYLSGSKIYKTKYDNPICIFREGKLLEIAPLSHGDNTYVQIIGSIDNFVYYFERIQGKYNEERLYCFNLESNIETLLYTGNFFLTNAIYFADDKSVYIPLGLESAKESKYVHVLGDTILGVERTSVGYPLGARIYYVEHTGAVETIVETDKQGNVLCANIPFALAYDRSVIPYSEGLLVHNKELQSLLYKIDMEGVVTELFNVECLSSISAVNIYEDYAFISVMRFEKHGEIGRLRYKNDTVEGTYSINLADGTVKKINDMCFNGIFNFDDTGFFCCTLEGDVYKMEFDGTVSPVLLLEETPFSLVNALS